MIIALIRYVFYALMTFTPLVMSSHTTEMFEFNKMILIYASSIVVGTAWTIHYILYRPKIQVPKLIIALAIFVGIQGLATVFSIDQHTSLYGYYGRWNGGLLSLISYSVLAFVLVQAFDKKAVIRLLIISLTTSGIVLLWGIPGIFGADLSCLVFVGELSNSCWTAQFQPAVRMFSTLGQPNWLGAYLAFHFFIALYFLHRSFTEKENSESQDIPWYHNLKPTTLTYVYGAYLLLNAYGILATKSRSALLAVLVSGAIGIILFITSRVKSELRILYRIVLISAILFSSYFIVSWGSIRMADDVPEHLQITDSFQIREIVWRGAIELGLRYPFLGTGPETFAYSYYFTRPEAHNLTSEWDFIYNKAHNEFLNTFATSGTLGLAGYVGLIVIAFLVFGNTSAKDPKENVQLGFFLALSYSTILITNFFGFSTSTLQLGFYLLPALFLAYKKDNILELKNKGNFHLMNKFLITGVVLMGVFTAWNLFSYYRADRLYKSAQVALAEDKYQLASQLLVQAIRLKYEHVYEDKLSSTLAQLALVSQFDQDSAQKDDLITLSKQTQESALQKAPQNVFYYRTKARNHYLYYQISGDMKDLDTAVKSMEFTTVLAPTDAQSFYMTGLFYQLLSEETKKIAEHEKGLFFLRKALQLRPNYIEANELLPKSL